MLNKAMSEAACLLDTMLCFEMLAGCFHPFTSMKNVWMKWYMWISAISVCTIFAPWPLNTLSEVLVDFY